MPGLKNLQSFIIITSAEQWIKPAGNWEGTAVIRNSSWFSALQSWTMEMFNKKYVLYASTMAKFGKEYEV